MVMWRCLIFAVGAALARSAAYVPQDELNARNALASALSLEKNEPSATLPFQSTGNEKLDAVGSALVNGDFSVLNDVEAVRILLDHGWDVNRRGAKWGEGERVAERTFLHLTANHKVVQLLLERGADVDLVDDHGQTPLMVASRDNRTEIVKVLLESSADATIARKDGLTPLHAATSQGNVMLIELLVKHGANVDAQILDGSHEYYNVPNDSTGHSPLHIAVKREHKDAIAALTKHGANWDLKAPAPQSYHYDSPADIGAANGMSRDQFERAPKGMPALHFAAYAGNTKRVSHLIANGADISASSRTAPFATALFFATQQQRISVVKLLIENGADTNAVNGEGDRPLHVAILDGSTKKGEPVGEIIVKMLLEGGADPNMRVQFGIDRKNYYYGNTPLHLTAIKGSKHMIELLYQHGANGRLKNNEGYTPVALLTESLDPKGKLIHRKTGRVLRLDETLESAGVDSGDTIIFASLEDQLELQTTMLKLDPAAASSYSSYRHSLRMFVAVAVVALTFVLMRKRREWARARATDELLRGDAAAAPKPKPQRGAKKPAKRRDAPRARRRQSPRARDPAPEEKTLEDPAPEEKTLGPAVAASEPKPAPAPRRTEPPRSAPIAATPPRAETPPPEPAPTRAEPPRPAPVAAPTPPPRAETPPPKAVPESKTEEPESIREEPEAPVVPRGYETVAHILEAHGESRLLATFEEQQITDETLPFLEASDLLELGVSPMAILAIVDISSAARGKAKKLDAEDVLHDVATHQSVLEKELAEHRAEIERLRIGRGEIPDHLKCGITLEIMKDPVMAADGHTYEKCAIEQWLATGARTSPTTNEPLASLQLLPNHLAKKAILDEMDAARDGRV